MMTHIKMISRCTGTVVRQLVLNPNITQENILKNEEEQYCQKVHEFIYDELDLSNDETNVIASEKNGGRN